MATSRFFTSSPRSSGALPSSSPLLAPQFKSRYVKENNSWITIGANGAYGSKELFRCPVHMASGHSGEPNKLNFDTLWNKAKNIWDSSPKPVKDFPWNRAFENFIQLVLDLTISVVKYLCVPTLAVSSISEMSYCAHERRLALVPFPLIIGMVVAGILQAKAVEISPRLKDAEVPWHLIAIVILFTLLKLPGPYYPYWGRIFVPHFANGVMWRTLWSIFFWHKRPKNPIHNNNNLEAK